MAPHVPSESPIYWDLWKTDGTEGNTKVVKPGVGIQNWDHESLVAAGNLVYFRGVYEDRDYLWRTDGSETGTIPLRALTLESPLEEYVGQG